jgi:hypothetical protein
LGLSLFSGWLAATGASVAGSASAQTNSDDHRPAQTVATRRVDNPNPTSELQANERVGRALAGAVDRVLQAKVGAVDGNPQVQNHVKQFKQQYARQFRQLLNTELLFIRSACHPTQKEFGRVRAAGKAIIEGVLREYAQAQFRPRPVISSLLQIDPRTLLSLALSKRVDEMLPEEKADSYRAELAQRVNARRRLAVLSILSKLDQHLVLTSDQREHFRRELDEDWDDTWCNRRVLTQGNRYLPVLPVGELLPLLTSAQKETWRSVYKHGNVHYGLHFAGTHGVEINLDDWDANE